jgi:hypothetical protein
MAATSEGNHEGHEGTKVTKKRSLFSGFVDAVVLNRSNK